MEEKMTREDKIESYTKFVLNHYDEVVNLICFLDRNNLRVEGIQHGLAPADYRAPDRFDLVKGEVRFGFHPAFGLKRVDENKEFHFDKYIEGGELVEEFLEKGKAVKKAFLEELV